MIYWWTTSRFSFLWPLVSWSIKTTKLKIITFKYSIHFTNKLQRSKFDISFRCIRPWMRPPHCWTIRKLLYQRYLKFLLKARKALQFELTLNIARMATGSTMFQTNQGFHQSEVAKFVVDLFSLFVELPAINKGWRLAVMRTCRDSNKIILGFRSFQSQFYKHSIALFKKTIFPSSILICLKIWSPSLMIDEEKLMEWKDAGISTTYVTWYCVKVWPEFKCRLGSTANVAMPPWRSLEETSTVSTAYLNLLLLFPTFSETDGSNHLDEVLFPEELSPIKL